MSSPGDQDRLGSGDDVLDWLRGGEAHSVASRRVRRCGLPGGDALVEDVLSDATIAVLQRMESPLPLDVDSPAGYGVAAIRSAVRRLFEARMASVEGDRQALEELARHGDHEPEHIDVTALDELRVVVEELGGPPWVTSSVLSCITFAMHPTAVPDDLPRPRAGARPDQARCWPALWLAGERELFPGSDGDPAARRRIRARRIEAVLTTLNGAVARRQMLKGTSHG